MEKIKNTWYYTEWRNIINLENYIKINLNCSCNMTNNTIIIEYKTGTGTVFVINDNDIKENDKN